MPRMGTEVSIPGVKLPPEPDVATQRGTFAMSWFWFPEAIFGAVPGVIRTRVGFTGGSKKNPTYRSLGDHTETMEVDFDPDIISYSQLLALFWKNHSSTTKNHTQYMSAIFCHGTHQNSLAEESMKKEQENSARKIVTQIQKADTFYNAENYHQKYMLRQHSNLLKSLGLDEEELITSHVAAKLNGYVAGNGSAAQFEKEQEHFGLNSDQRDYVRRQVQERRP